MYDHINLKRFINAQESVYQRVISELKEGKKATHWMWFIFPQIEGLGRSATAQQYAIHSEEEAQAYLEDPILGTRLRECTQLVMNIEDCTARQIFGYPDDLKFHSSMTLFDQVGTRESIFQEALLKYYEGEPDTLTLSILKSL